MKKVVKVMLPLLFAATSFGQANWLRIVGVITAPGFPNPVAGIPSGGLPWTTTSDSATVNIQESAVSIRCRGTCAGWLKFEWHSRRRDERERYACVQRWHSGPSQYRHACSSTKPSRGCCV